VILTRMDPIAIVGLGCRFPGASGPEAFWRLLLDGRDAIVEVPANRWNREALYHHDPVSAPGSISNRLGGFLGNIELFDAGFFGISPREAAAMDPQQRMLLETTWEAIDDAGLIADALRGEKVGVFVGIAAYDYAEIQHAYDNRSLIGPHTNTGLALSIAANRISYIFDLRGPSIAVDTACSSSLVAVHLACRSLQSQESRIALVGGVNAILKPEATIGFSRASMLSPDGRCRTFDARANGYTRGEGAGVVVLKRLSDALEANDHIYALICGSAVNQDGRTNGMSVPSRDAQEAALHEAFQTAQIDPAQVQYVEAHGTGTPVGDPIEAHALGSVLGPGRGNDRCLVGSVKTNIGHLEAAAGIAGLIKTALAIERRTIPASLNFESPNPEIPLEQLNLRINTQTEPWPDNGHPARAGINSFGFGGTNAHVVLQEAPRADGQRVPTAPRDAPLILPLSARAPEALRALATSYADLIEREGGDSERLHAICYWAAARRSHHAYRTAAVGRSPQVLTTQLRSFASSGAAAQANRSTLSKPGPAFVFSGMGSQWWAMARQLLAAEPVFRDTVERCDVLFRRRAEWSLMRELTADEADSRMSRTEIAQPCNFAVQVALAALWRSWGIVPGAVVGHSAGEMAACYVAGVLSLEDATEVAFQRSRLQQRASGRGKMAAVGITEAEARERIARYDGRLSIAAVNGPEALTLSGDSDALEEVVAALNEAGAFVRFLRVDVPYHSHHMSPLEHELRAALSDLRPQSPSIPLFSTVTGEAVEARLFDADYWWNNVREPVFFSRAVAAMVHAGHDTFLEVSPHPVLASAVSECLAANGTPGTVVASLRREADEQETMLRSLGDLYARGFAIAWTGVYPLPAPFTRLPQYAWQQQPYWHESTQSRNARLTSVDHPLLGRRRNGPRLEWETLLNPKVLSYLSDHRVEDSIVFPGAGYVEMALAVGRAELGTIELVVEDIAFERALLLPEAESVQVLVAYEPDTDEIAVHASADQSQWELHARSKIRPLKHAAKRVDFASLQLQCEREVLEPYAIFASAGLDYGPAFQGIEQLWCGPGAALARLRSPPSDDRYILHPTVLDACFQVFVGTLAADGRMPAYLPVAIAKLVVCAALDGQKVLWAHARISERSETRLVGDIRLFNADGNVLAEVQGFSCRALGAQRATTLTLANSLYAFRWQADGSAGIPVAEGLLNPDAIGERVRARMAEIADPAERVNYYREVEPALDLACARIAAGAFAQLGRVLRAGDVLKVAALCEEIGTKSENERLIARMLAMLEANGTVRREGDDWRVLASVDPNVTAAEILDPLALQFPLYAPEIDLLRRCAEQLPEVLCSEIDPLQLIFPDGSQAVAERIYRDSRSFGIYNAIGREAVSAIVDALPERSTLRILEIGAGVGSLTAEILSLLPEDRTYYVFTDLSGTFTQKAAQKFSRHRFVDYRTFDLEQPPEHLAPNSFHIVLASDVLHATRDLERSLNHVRDLLAPDGLLIACELTKPPFWFDLVFGLLPGWWLFDDKVRSDHACLPGAAWRALLQHAGFVQTELLSEGNAAGDTVHSVIVARSPARAPAQAGGAEVQSGVWLLLSDAAGVATRFAQELAGVGQSAVAIDCIGGANGGRPVAPGWMRTRIARAIAENPELRGVVYLRGLDYPLAAAAAEVLDAADEICAGALDLMQAIAESSQSADTRLILVTAGAERVLATDAVDPVQASLWGLARVFFNEHPDVRSAIVDLSSAPEDGELALLAAECLSASGESEIALRGRARFVHRLEAAALDSLALGFKRPARPGETFQLDYAKPGAFENLLVRASERVAPGPGQVQIRVAAAGLNFRDIMKMLDIYPTDGDARHVLGDECTGTVVAVGEGVHRIAVGDRVAAIVGGFRSSITVSEELVVGLPDRISFTQGATIPIAFVTAYYALHRLAHLRAGERVLIHAAAGGVGQAALQVARLAGAEVFATAGTAEKRDALRAEGIRHVLDSRSLDFADQVMELTAGKGVDVVLNSLAGRAIPKSLMVLAPHGRFLEIGKTDIYRDSKLGLRPFRKNLSYFAIDLDAIFKERCAIAKELLHEVMQDMAAGRLQPLSNRVFPVSQAEHAFRYMAQAKHIGKVVLSMEDARLKISPRRFDAFPLHADATYLITGGLGGLGRVLARWMIEHGARNIVLLGRSAPSSEVQADVDVMRATGARIEIVGCDATDEAALAARLAALRTCGPPLRGVIHCSMVLDDGLISQLNHDRLHRVLAPKIAGAWSLHTLTRGDPLDFFVLFSSFASMVGNIGQANYAAANAFLDALAHRRRGEGRPALTVNWGAIGASGYVAQHVEIEQHFQRHGLRSFLPDQAFAVLEALLRREVTEVGVVDIDWKTWGRYAPEIARSPRFAHLMKEERAPKASGPDLVLERLRAAPAAERKKILLTAIREQLSAVLGLAADGIDANQSLNALGLDSLMAVELSCLIEDRLRFKPGTIELIQAPSLTALADRFMDKIAL
jgi:acyl transferase domain-containing protein/SAM-dependent methyltransferase/acyl carrier protein